MEHSLHKVSTYTQTKTGRQHEGNKLLHYNHLMASFPGQPGSAGTRKVKPIWILLEQETVSGSGISWAICKSAPRSRQIHASTPPLCFFTGQMPFLQPNQQHQSTEGNKQRSNWICSFKISENTQNIYIVVLKKNLNTSYNDTNDE